MTHDALSASHPHWTGCPGTVAAPRSHVTVRFHALTPREPGGAGALPGSAVQPV